MRNTIYYYLKGNKNPAIWLHAYLECLAEKRPMRVLPQYTKYLQHELNLEMEGVGHENQTS